MKEPLHSISNALTKLLFHLMGDDKDHITKAGAPCVKQGKIYDEMASRIDWLDLLETAEAAAHAGCQNNKSWIFHTALL